MKKSEKRPVISIHEYQLEEGIDGKELIAAVNEAERRKLFALPGLKAHFLVKAIRGRHKGLFAMVWYYESKTDWQRLWGSVDKPKTQTEYPAQWKIWEKELLAPLLDRDPDAIDFTAYEVV